MGSPTRVRPVVRKGSRVAVADHAERASAGGAPTRTLFYFEAGGPAVGVAAEAPQGAAWSKFTQDLQ